eukprot:6202135-Pleurochrysis_carterae.AAC.1
MLVLPSYPPVLALFCSHKLFPPFSPPCTCGLPQLDLRRRDQSWRRAALATSVCSTGDMSSGGDTDGQERQHALVGLERTDQMIAASECASDI